MSIRIHALAKELEMPSKDLVDFINQRKDVYGLDIKTPSNAIAPLYAEMIVSDVKKFRQAAQEEPKPEEKPAEDTAQKDKKIVKTSEEVEAEKAAAAEKEEAKAAESKPAEEKKPEPVAEEPKPEQPAPPPVKRPNAPPPLPVMTKRPAPITPPPFRPLKTPSVPKKEESIEKTDAGEVTLRMSKDAPARPVEQAAAPQKPQQEKAPEAKVPSMPAPQQGARPPSIPPMGFTKAPAVPPMPRFGFGFRPAAQQQPVDESQFKTVQVKPPIIVRDFAKLIDVKPFKLISELMDMGIFASMNLSLDEAVAVKIAKKHGYNLEIHHRGEQQQRQLQAQEAKRKAAMLIDDPKNLEPRPPIVCILGHVDHGKTTLLDTIRNAHVAAGEAGGITQHTAAYQVDRNGKKITFLDTPGHAAFSKMRERGANVTDIAILVVAADDGFMPQTDEALSFAQKAGVPIVVAINKMDAKGANIDRVKQQMQKRGITSEDWGGETLCCAISALKNQNIDNLLDLVLLQAEMLELKANPKRAVAGDIIESQLEPGRGATATVIVRAGTLKPGDVIVCGHHWCKVRAMLDDKGAKIQKAPPSTPVVVMGWTGAPEAGDHFEKAENDRAARKLTEERILEDKKKAALESKSDKPASLEDLMAAIEHKDQKVFRCIVKSDVSGTVEALSACLKDIKSTKVSLEVISESVGLITKNDIEFASTAKAAIVAFNVKQENGVASLAKHEGVEIIQHNIIYELINMVRDGMKNLLDPELKENKLGQAEVRAVFNVTKGGKVAGCMVTEGVIKRDKFARVFRNGKEISKGRVGDLKRFKDDASEVRAGYECGMNITGFNDYQSGDIIECFEILEIRPDL